MSHGHGSAPPSWYDHLFVVFLRCMAGYLAQKMNLILFKFLFDKKTIGNKSKKLIMTKVLPRLLLQPNSGRNIEPVLEGGEKGVVNDFK